MRPLGFWKVGIVEEGDVAAPLELRFERIRVETLVVHRQRDRLDTAPAEELQRAVVRRRLDENAPRAPLQLGRRVEVEALQAAGGDEDARRLDAVALTEELPQWAVPATGAVREDHRPVALEGRARALRDEARVEAVGTVPRVQTRSAASPSSLPAPHAMTRAGTWPRGTRFVPGTKTCLTTSHVGVGAASSGSRWDAGGNEIAVPACAVRGPAEELAHLGDGDGNPAMRQTRDRAMAAPRPVLRPLAYAGAHWVQSHVPKRLEMLLLRRDEAGAKARLEHVADVAMPLVEPTGVGPVESVHAPREHRLGQPDDEMHVIRHEAEAPDPPPLALHSPHQNP